MADQPSSYDIHNLRFDCNSRIGVQTILNGAKIHGNTNATEGRAIMTYRSNTLSAAGAASLRANTEMR